MNDCNVALDLYRTTNLAAMQTPPGAVLDPKFWGPGPRVVMEFRLTQKHTHSAYDP